MNDLSEYFSDKDRIKHLERQVVNLIAGKSKWKLRCEKLQGKQPEKVSKPPRLANARPLIINWHNGDKSLTFKQIADRCYLTEQDIKNISCKIRKELNITKVAAA